MANELQAVFVTDEMVTHYLDAIHWYLGGLTDAEVDKAKEAGSYARDAVRVGLIAVLRSDEFKRLVEESTWQPIETAPKDGETALLLWDGDESGPYVGYRGEDFPDDGACDVHGIACYPTHWRRLPAPPAIDASRTPEIAK